MKLIGSLYFPTARIYPTVRRIPPCLRFAGVDILVYLSGSWRPSRRSIVA